MPLVKSRHKNRIRSTRIDFPDANGNPDPGNFLTIHYHPEHFDDAFQQEAQSIERRRVRRQREIDAIDDDIARDDAQAALDREQAEAGSRLLLRMLAGWDLFDDDDMTIPTPLNADELRSLGAPTLRMIMNAITEEMNPSPNGFGAPSAPSSNR